MGKQTLLTVGGGGLSAAAVLALLLGLPGGMIVAYLAPLPLIAVGLGLGGNAAALAAAVGVVVIALVGGFMAAGVYGGLHALPSWLLVHQALLRRPAVGGDADGWLPVGTIAATLAALTVFVSFCTAVEAGLDGGIRAAVEQLLTEAMTILGPNLEPENRVQVVAMLAPLFVGFSAISWQIMILINALIAQRLLASRGRALRPSPRWSEMTLPHWLSWPLVASALVGLVGAGDLAYLGRNLAIGLMVPYFLLGLSIVHRHSRRWSARVPLLVVFYIALILFTAVIGTAVAGLGMISQWSGAAPLSAQGRSRQE